jgi:hypothetical protein
MKKTVDKWAVVSRKTGKIKSMLGYGHEPLIYDTKDWALDRCNKSERVVPITISYEFPNLILKAVDSREGEK